MKQSKLIFSILFIFAISVTSIFAQSRGGAMLEKKMEHLTEALDLNEEQQTQLKAILKDGMKKQMALKEQEGERKDKKEAFKAIRDEQMKAVEAILTKDQLVTFEAQKKESAEKMKEMRQKRMAMRKKGDKVDKKSIKSEMQSYKEENIQPVLNAERRKFDQYLTSDEKQTINEVRGKLKAQKAEFASFKKNHKKGDEISDEQKAKFTTAKEEMKAEMEKVKTIAKKYETQLKAVRENIAPQREKWQADMKKIAEKHGVEYEKGDMEKRKEERTKERKGEHSKKQGKRGKRGEFGKRGMKEMSPVGFLLLNPDEAPKTTKVTYVETTIKVYPNPAQSFNNIAFNLATAGDIIIELHDQDGNLIKTVLNEYRPAGSHTVRVNLGDLKGFVYLYVLKDAEGNVLTEKFVLRK